MLVARQGATRGDQMLSPADAIPVWHLRAYVICVETAPYISVFMDL